MNNRMRFDPFSPGSSSLKASPVLLQTRRYLIDEIIAIKKPPPVIPTGAWSISYETNTTLTAFKPFSSSTISNSTA